jgi:hypothetical protein
MCLKYSSRGDSGGGVGGDFGGCDGGDHVDYGIYFGGCGDQRIYGSSGDYYGDHGNYVGCGI